MATTEVSRNAVYQVTLTANIKKGRLTNKRPFFCHYNDLNEALTKPSLSTGRLMDKCNNPFSEYNILTCISATYLCGIRP